MDITFQTGEGRFNDRVCAIIIRENRLLAMHDERSPYFYLPGGRVRMHETAEEAVLREMKEELETNARIIRPLWLSQSFFIEEVSREKYHELCFYFLVSVNGLEQGETFTLYEGGHTHTFEWLPFEQLREAYLHPSFIKEEIFHLPQTLTLRVDEEYERSPSL